MKIRKAGDLQEWMDDWGQREQSHRHISHLYGLFPGNQISARRTPELAAGAHVVLDQRGFPGTGWASAGKAASWTGRGRIRSAQPLRVMSAGKAIRATHPEPGLTEFAATVRR